MTMRVTWTRTHRQSKNGSIRSRQPTGAVEYERGSKGLFLALTRVLAFHGFSPEPLGDSPHNPGPMAGLIAALTNSNGSTDDCAAR
jgi:hypothetical protein